MRRPLSIGLRDLALYGRFGPIRLGSCEDEVLAQLGKPDAKGGTSRTHRRPSVWKYGDVELHFDRKARTVCLIDLGHFSIPTGGSRIHLDPWVIRGGLTRRELGEALDAEGVSWSVVSSLQPGVARLRTETGFEFLVEEQSPPEERRPPWGLCAAYLSRANAVFYVVPDAL